MFLSRDVSIKMSSYFIKLCRSSVNSFIDWFSWELWILTPLVLIDLWWVSRYSVLNMLTAIFFYIYSKAASCKTKAFIRKILTVFLGTHTRIGNLPEITKLLVTQSCDSIVNNSRRGVILVTIFFHNSESVYH